MGHVTKGEDKNVMVEFKRGKIDSLKIKARAKKAVNLYMKYWKIKEPFDL